jgi:putative transposase
MPCPPRASSMTMKRPVHTALGFRRFHCGDCKRTFNERIGTLFNHLQYPTAVVCLVVLWRHRYKLSLRDLAAMFLHCGINFTHEAVRGWERTLAPVLGETLRQRRDGTGGTSWYADETYVRVDGRWQYLYRANDRDGNLVDVRLSNTRDLAAAEIFFRAAWTGTGLIPHRITTDGHDAYPRAIRAVFGEQVTHRTNRDLNNHLEQDHRGIKQRYRLMGGFNHGTTAARLCYLFDEVRAFLRPPPHRHQVLSRKQRRAIRQERFAHLMGLMATA